MLTIIYTCVWVACPHVLLGHDVSNFLRGDLQQQLGCESKFQKPTIATTLLVHACYGHVMGMVGLIQRAALELPFRSH